MADARLGTVLRHVRRLALPAHAQGLSDAQLLERFRASREESAFAALMQRHGGLVWGVCRNVLGHAQDAEDAFQATFLVLASRATAVRDGAAVASWLHGTAYRIAMKAKRDAARRRTNEARARPAAAAPASEGAWRELQATLDEEVRALPERQRAVFVLCVLEGKSHAEAAGALGWKEGTVSSTLSRARERLRGRLARRGVALSALLTGLALGQSAAAVPTLAGSALRAVLGEAVVPPRVAALVKGVTDTMISTKLKAATALLLTVALVAGAGAVARQAPPPAPEADRPAEVKPAEKAKEPADALGDPLPAGAVARLGTVRFRHAGDVGAFALSPDGKTLASAGGSAVVLWDAATGKELRRFEGHPKAVHAIAFTPDGKSVASGADDNTIRLWDAATGKQLRTFEGHEERSDPANGGQYNGVYRLLFTPDGKLLVSRGADNTVRVWEVGTGRTLHRFDGLSGMFRAVALSPDGKTLVAAVGDFKQGPSELRLWETATGRELRRLPQTGTATCVAFSHDGKTLAIGLGSKGWNEPAHVVLRDATSFEELRTLKGHRSWVTALAFAPDGKTLASGSYDPRPHLWDVKEGKELAQLGVRLPVYAAAFTPDGKTLVTECGNNNDHAIRLWDVATRKEVGRLAGHQSSVAVLAFAPDGKALASAAADATVGVWDLAGRKEVHRLSADGWGGTALGFSADGRALVSGGMGSKVMTWDPRSGQEGGKFDTKDGYFGRMAVSPNGKVLASWGRGRNSVGLWDAATGKELRRLDSVSPWVNALAFSPDGALLAVGTGQGPPYITVWEVATGRLVRQMGGDSWVWSLAFSPDGRTLASGHDDKKVRVWEVATGGERFAFDHGDRAGALAFSPDGTLLASASNESSSNFATTGINCGPLAGQDEDKVRLWDPFTGARLHTLAGHRGAVACLAFSPDGRLLASGGNDTTVLLWDATKLPRPERPKGADLGAKELAAAWSDLGSADAARAYRQMRELATSPRPAVALLKEHVRPVVLADPKVLAKLIADLDSDVFDIRDKATKELENLGAGAEPALRKALADRPPLEVSRRIEGVLAKLRGQLLPLLRAVELLERLDKDDARKLLAALAEGAAGARLTREARAALERLGKRAARP